MLSNFCYSDVTPQSCTINSRPHFQLPSSSIGFSLNFCESKNQKRPSVSGILRIIKQSLYWHSREVKSH
ncbi:hypothetical protein OIU74_029727 [Salix koriyanagi]|uniref:Uncharacterized protein n=1 Tax=Salix koriyanagi TaxID=2511006 RepID=A0A9Q0ZUE3_9ROSI|nr:hypothetical protein OIU74_029727 [Salix koriyanagi]